MNAHTARRIAMAASLAITTGAFAQAGTDTGGAGTGTSGQSATESPSTSLGKQVTLTGRLDSLQAFMTGTSSYDISAMPRESGASNTTSGQTGGTSGVSSTGGSSSGSSSTGGASSGVSAGTSGATSSGGTSGATSGNASGGISGGTTGMSSAINGLASPMVVIGTEGVTILSRVPSASTSGGASGGASSGTTGQSTESPKPNDQVRATGRLYEKAGIRYLLVTTLDKTTSGSNGGAGSSSGTGSR